VPVAARPVVLTWEGKPAALAALDRAVPSMTAVETVPAAAVPAAAGKNDAPSPPDGGPDRGRHRVVRGDALDVSRALLLEGLGGRVDLVYLDPPYASGADYTHEERVQGPATGRVARTAAYRDRWEDGPASYLDMLYPRLSAMRPLLKPSGSIWVQVDWRASYLVRALCDEVFGRDRFLNEIVWRRAPNLGRQARSGQFGRTLDTIVVYGAGKAARLIPPHRLSPVRKGGAKLDARTGRYYTVAPRGDYTDESVARLEAEGRIHRSPTGNTYVKYWLETDSEGQLCKRQPIDALWIDIPPLRHVSPEERTGYPTQKPRCLLERIILAGSPEGGMVVDLFAGSGTTAAAAARLGRSFIVGDSSPVAVATMRSRLLREGVAPLDIEQCGQRPACAEDPIVGLMVARSGAKEATVTLSCDARHETIAWAIDPSPSSEVPFCAKWHAERGSGRRPKVLPLEARLPLPRGARSIRARIYFVDGSIRELAVAVPPQQPEQLSLSAEGLP
jgi:DNA modification methylase